MLYGSRLRVGMRGNFRAPRGVACGAEIVAGEMISQTKASGGLGGGWGV